jgi:AbrB family looped-hinge helix DNA binding protein
METTRLSSKGQVIIPKTIRDSRHWSPGLELQIIDSEEGVLLKPMAPFEESVLQDVAGCLKREGEAPMNKDEVTEAIRKGVREAWRGRS